MTASALFARSQRFGEDLCYAHTRSENRFKRRRQKTVTWPIDQKICEVCHFLVDDAPSILGAAVRESLRCVQGKSLSNNETQGSSSIDVWGAKRVKVDRDNVPPGFGLSCEGGQSRQPNAELDVDMAITFPWHQPLKFLLDDSWLWARGEDSCEVSSQHQRESRFFEAFYPRLASIPDRPKEPQEPSQKIDDTLLVEIPLVPLEDEDTVNEDFDQQRSIGPKTGVTVLHIAGRAKADVLAPTSDGLYNASMNQKQESMISTADSNIAAAGAAAACMVVKALGESDRIDQKLLVEILKNPSLLTSLTSSHIFVKGKNQDNDKSPPGVRQAAPQNPPHNLAADRGARLNRSPVGVLAPQYGDSVGDGADATITQRLAPILRTSTHVQQARNCVSESLNSLLPTRIPTSCACSTSKSSMDILQKEVDCTSREHKQVSDVPKLNAYCNSTLNEAPSLQGFRLGDEMGSKNDHTSNNSHYCHMQEPLHLSSTFRASPTLPLKHPMQEPLKYTSTETSPLPRKTVVYGTSSKAGGRNKKPCMYFNTPRGCRNGDSCAFVHQSLGSGANVSSHPSLHSTAFVSLC